MNPTPLKCHSPPQAGKRVPGNKVFLNPPGERRGMIKFKKNQKYFQISQ